MHLDKQTPEKTSLDTLSLLLPSIIRSVPVLEDKMHEGSLAYVEYFLKNRERPMMAELSKKNETELVSRVWMERLPSGINMAWATGLLKHEGVLTQTPELIGLPLSDKNAEQLWDIFNNNDHKELKSRVEQLLYERLVKQETTFLGEDKNSEMLKMVDNYMQLGPDQNVHFFVHGWTGCHTEFIEHMAQMIDGHNRNFRDAEFKNKWVNTIYANLINNSGHAGLTILRKQLRGVVNLVSKKWGAFDPENHVYVGLGIQGAMGTTPEEIGERIGTQWSNESVSPNELVVQVGAAINEFANNLAGKNEDNTQSHQDIRARILTKVAHLWGHSMGGWVVLQELDQKSYLSELLRQVGNDRMKVHAWNPVFLGSKLTEDEYERLNQYVPEELIQMAIKSVNMHEPGLLKLLVSGAPKLLKPKIMQILNKALGVSKMTQDHLLGSMRGAASHGAHADVTANSLNRQYQMNQATLAAMPMVIKNLNHRYILREKIGNGSLDIWNGTNDNRILNKLSILVLQIILRMKTNIQTIDHLISPEKMAALSPLLVLPMRGKVLGGEYDLAQYMRILMDPDSFAELIQPLSALRRK